MQKSTNVRMTDARDQCATSMFAIHEMPQFSLDTAIFYFYISQMIDSPEKYII
jgi:hypothetical protein